MPKGGKRAGAGRKPKAAAKPESGNDDFASRVLARLGKKGWRDVAGPGDVANAEDYQLYLLNCGDIRVQERNFNRLLDRKYGEPVHPVNHLHDAPIEMNVTFSLADRIREGRERAAKR